MGFNNCGYIANYVVNFTHTWYPLRSKHRENRSSEKTVQIVSNFLQPRFGTIQNCSFLIDTVHRCACVVCTWWLHAPASRATDGLGNLYLLGIYVISYFIICSYFPSLITCIISKVCNSTINNLQMSFSSSDVNYFFGCESSPISCNARS